MLNNNNKLVLQLMDKETTINISELNEVDYWTYKWKISTFQLFEAIEKTKSTIVSIIEAYLRKKNLIK